MKKNRTALMVAVLLFGGFLSLFNETILNIALPAIMLDLGVEATMVQWLSTGYVLIVAIMVPLTAFLIQTFDTKKLYLTAMGALLCGTLLGWFSTSFTTLLIARLIQSVGTGVLAPVMINTCLAVTPRHRQGFMMGLCTCIILVGPTLGPIASGIVMQFFDWHVLFAILIPLIAICIIGSLLYIKKTVPLTKPKIDYLSIILSSFGFALLVYGMSTINTNIKIAAPVFFAGIVFLIFFCRRQMGLKEPMLNINVFKSLPFTLGAILVVLIQMFQFSISIILPILYQIGLGLSSFASAMYLFPAVLVCSILTVIAGKMYDRFSGKVLIPLGVILMTTFIYFMSGVTLGTSAVVICMINIAILFGIALAWSPIQSTALSGLSSSEQTHGVTIINMLIQLGSALGAPLFVGLFAKGQERYQEGVSATTEEVSRVAIYM